MPLETTTMTMMTTILLRDNTPAMEKGLPQGPTLCPFASGPYILITISIHTSIHTYIHCSEFTSYHNFCRKEAVIYDDGLSEIQFQKFVEKQFAEAENSSSVKKTKSEKVLSGDKMSVHCKSALAVLSAVMKLKKSDGQKLCFWFFEKPNKKMVPEYYQQIREPISLKEIGSHRKFYYTYIIFLKNFFFFII